MVGVRFTATAPLASVVAAVQATRPPVSVTQTWTGRCAQALPAAVTVNVVVAAEPYATCCAAGLTATAGLTLTTAVLLGVGVGVGALVVGVGVGVGLVVLLGTGFALVGVAV